MTCPEELPVEEEVVPDAPAGDADDQAAGLWRYRQVVAGIPGLSVLAFDHQLRVQIAEGEALRRSGFDGAGMVGRLLDDALPAPALNRLRVPFEAALTGRTSNLCYRSPVDGRQFRLRVTPLYGRSGDVVGGVSLGQDSSADLARMAQLEHLERLGNVGGGWFDLASGWTFDPQLLRLLDVETDAEAEQVCARIQLPGHAYGWLGFLGVLTTNGSASAQGSLVDAKTGQLRQLFGTGTSTRDGDDRLLHAVITVTDVTDSIDERERAQEARAAAAQARTLLIRRVSDVLATQDRTIPELTQSITDIAATAIGDGALLRILTADGQGIETQLISHSLPAAVDRVRTFVEANSDFLGRPEFRTPTGSGDSWVHLGDPGPRRQHTGPGVRPDTPPELRHVVVAPVRHIGRVVGYLMVFRADRDRPYEPGDDDLVQVLADRIGDAVVESRVQQVLEQQRSERRAIVEQLAEMTAEQHELLEQLADVAERERSVLAEAIHDDPLQLIVAAILRMDLLQVSLPKPQADELEQLAETLQESVEHLRTLIVALTPPDLSDGVGVALRELAEALFIGTDASVTLVETAQPNIVAPRGPFIYRVLREALMNARKHSQATAIAIRVVQEDASIIAMLSDNGVGATVFDAGPGHLGVATMHARARSAGGRLLIDSAPGAGTTVTLTLPAPEGRAS